MDVYVKANIHFIVDDNCEGLTAGVESDRIEQSATFQKADDIIYYTNWYFSSISGSQQFNQAVHGAAVTTPQCNGFRFILDEVFIHCDSDLQEISLGERILPHINQDDPSAYNVYVTLNTGNANGFVYSIGGRETVVERY